MRLIHTADWHLGRSLKGKDRTVEIEFALDEMVRRAKELDVDAVLVAGDIFETFNPPVEAERVAYEFFCKLQAAKIPAIAIAGNHDSSTRIDSLASLLSFVGVHALGKPRTAEDGGVITLDTPGGKLCVGAMPFANERRMLDPDELWNLDNLQQLQSYRDTVDWLLSDLTSSFRDDSVNVLMSHITIDGAKLANSEKDFHSKGIYALPRQSLPPEAQYIALGHIHKRQSIEGYPHAFYSGSLIQVDFGEAGEDKGFNLITLEPGMPASVDFIPIACQKSLKVVECNLSDLDELETHRHHLGYLKVIVNLQTPQVGLADKVRKICPQTIHIEPRYPETNLSKEESFSGDNLDPLVEFQRYYQQQLGDTPTRAVVMKFEELYKEMHDATT